MGLVGVGFSFAVSAVTATVVETVPHRLAGMASATTSMLRDFGFTLGPAVIGAVAAARSTAAFHSALAGSSLAARRHGRRRPADHGRRQPAGRGGTAAHQPRGRGVPTFAVHALGHGYAVGYVVCGVAAVACCVFTVFALRRAAVGDQRAFDPDPVPELS